MCVIFFIYLRVYICHWRGFHRNGIQRVLIASCPGLVQENINVPTLIFIYLTKVPTFIFSWTRPGQDAIRTLWIPLPGSTIEDVHDIAETISRGCSLYLRVCSLYCRGFSRYCRRCLRHFRGCLLYQKTPLKNLRKLKFSERFYK